MRIKSITFGNWLCFSGQQTIELEAKPYAIIARHRKNVERSNWLGKSATLEAIRFGLTGWHRHRTEDEWITHGADKGGITIVLEDGTEIFRSRKRGQSTRLNVSGATQDLAQQRIYELMGLSERDFLATSYFEQGQMARFITQEASERTSTVTSWLRLDPLMAMEESHKTQLAKLTWDATVTREQLKATDDLEVAELAGFENFDALQTGASTLKDDIKKTRTLLDRARIKLEANTRSAVNDERKKQLAAIIEEGMKLKEIVSKFDVEVIESECAAAKQEYERLTGERSVTSLEVQQKRKLSTGNFDGNCPVAGIKCPVKSDINKRHTENSKLYQEASEKLVTLATKQDNAQKTWEVQEARIKVIERANERMDLLRRQGEELQESIDEDLATADANAGGDVQRLTTKLQDDIGKLATYERSIAAIEKSRGERLRLATLLSALEKAITIEREAKAIVGRNGAQRRISESCLKSIENGANDMLTECNIDLRVKMQWSREGTTLANACDECGHPYPKTARAKVCERCTAPRGMNVINKLEPVLSNTSGAAKDLAGAAFQLSASAWMRRNRGARWSAAMLDEPFGQLDAANRKAFSTHLVTLLRSRYGFEQSFTIAHHASTLDALPGRIEIVGDGNTSFIKVVS